MTLDEACSGFEALFGGVIVDAKSEVAQLILCSGALGLAGYPPPVLCASESLAIELWRRTARDVALDWADENKIETAAGRLIWIREPVVMKFKMTMQDETGGHRFATARYAVYSLCAIEKLPQHVDPCLSTDSKTPPPPKRRGRRPKTQEPSENSSSDGQTATTSPTNSQIGNSPPSGSAA